MGMLPRRAAGGGELVPGGGGAAAVAGKESKGSTKTLAINFHHFSQSANSDNYTSSWFNSIFFVSPHKQQQQQPLPKKEARPPTGKYSSITRVYSGAHFPI